MSEPAKILVVDDDHDLVTTLRLILEEAGYRVISAPDAEQGMARAEGERPDLILLDIMMPNATEGFHFVWKLRRREEPYFQTVPIVVLSAIHETTDLRFYPDSGDGTYRADAEQLSGRYHFRPRSYSQPSRLSFGYRRCPRSRRADRAKYTVS